ncbi:MAG: phosphate ABC transporter substrate-binding protein PstS family protein [Candidatus Omnitrophica bacterium]|nr:phosphate ABC transporter substrate-binding protein PstS family protein [Candidatus Omnitrophota bacterium]
MYTRITVIRLIFENQKEDKMSKRVKKVIVFLAVGAMAAAPVTQAKEQLQVKGSDTMVNLIQRMSEVYMQKSPEKKVVVTGGGSGTGIAGLRNRTVDIADSSRQMRKREEIDLKAKGVDPVRIIIARDCVTIITHKDNKVDKLTTDQLGAVFRGDINNWKELGGEDMPITLYGRQSNSGTFFLFRQEVLKGDYSDKMRRMNGNAQIIESVKNDKSGVGYVGVGHAKTSSGLKVIAVAKEEGGEYLDPTRLSASEVDKYPISRQLNQFVNGKPEGTARDFIAFELSGEGQKICEEMGFFPVSEENMEHNREEAGI